MSGTMMMFWVALGFSATLLVAMCSYFVARKGGSGTAHAVMVASGAACAFILIYVAVSTFITQYLLR
jgi:hypothetical protein